MPPRLRCSAAPRLARLAARPVVPAACSFNMPGYYAAAYATSTGSSIADGLAALRLPPDYVPPKQPPSARPPQVRKSQLLRTYTQMLRSTPLVLLFQHNSLTATEWAALRRELHAALDRVPLSAGSPDIAPGIQIQIVRSRIFDVALKIVEYFDPSAVKLPPRTAGVRPPKNSYTHDLSTQAHAVVKKIRAEDLDPATSGYAQLHPSLAGPLAVVTFPSVSPQHLAAALSILSPQAPAFPAPSRKKNPGYHDPICQSALSKLLLVGGRVEGQAFEAEGIRWVGGIESGIEGLRAQLVYLLQSAGLGLTSALEGAGKSLWLTMESRRSVLEEAEKGPGGDKPVESNADSEATPETEKKD